MAYGSKAFRRGASVSKSDSTPLVGACRALYVGGTGDLVVVLRDDYNPANKTAGSVTLEAVPAGSLLELAVVMVLNSTTATKIVALY